MSANTPLISTGEGTYELSDKAEKVRANTKTGWVDYVINSSDHLGLFEGDLNFPGKAVPTKLGAFLEFLESKGEIDVKLGNHSITRSEVDGKVQFSIESDTDAVYKLITTFPASRGKPNVKNAGAWIDLETVKSSPHITLVQNFMCPPLWDLGSAFDHLEHSEAFNHIAKVQEGHQHPPALAVHCVPQEASASHSRQHCEALST